MRASVWRIWTFSEAQLKRFQSGFSWAQVGGLRLKGFSAELQILHWEHVPPFFRLLQFRIWTCLLDYILLQSCSSGLDRLMPSSTTPASEVAVASAVTLLQPVYAYAFASGYS